MQPSDDLRCGRRAVEGLAGVDLLSDLVWHEDKCCFALRFRIALPEGEMGALPPVAEWFALVEPTYPFGDISIVPAQLAGITTTYPHQRRNVAQADVPWRTGKICLQTPMAVQGRTAFDVEPFEPERRLRWSVERAREWIIDAARGSLARPGEPFELPDYPVRSRTVVMFSEGVHDLASWAVRPERFGLVELVALSDAPEQLVVTAFTTIGGKPVVRPAWGTAISASTKTRRGVWLRMERIPVLSPWAAPETWGELSTILEDQGIAVADVVRRLVPHIRDGRQHIALIGFPIPSTVDGPPERMHWCALELPPLSTGTHPGFRNNERSHWLRDQVTAFGTSREIAWASSENWQADELASRGRLKSALRTKRILLLGAGAVGSAIAEYLVRGGVTDILVMDGETLAAGNLVRHTLTLENVGRGKAEALAAHLNRISPHARIEALAAPFPPRSGEHDMRMRECGLVLDCTSSDAVLHALGTFAWGADRVFASLSVGFEAKRMFIFSGSAEKFPHAAFQKAVGPWLEKERAEQGGRVMPREGVGCWNAVFPAAAHEVGLLCAAAATELERSCEGPTSTPRFVVLERSGGDDAPLLRRIVADE